jgi:hypothetical protein
MVLDVRLVKASPCDVLPLSCGAMGELLLALL